MAYSKRKGRVCVVGAGVMGLASAVNIIETIPNVDVTLVAENFSQRTASIASGGMWNPRDSLAGTSLNVLQDWTRATWKHILPLAQSPEGAKIGLEFIPGYRMHIEPINEGVPWYKDDMIGFRRVSQSEINDLFPNSPFKDGYSFVTIITNGALYLPYLTNRFKRGGGKVEQRKIKSFEEFAGKYDVVVNCAGVGARLLAKDDSVEPLRGQVLKVRAPWQRFLVLVYDQYDVTTQDKLIHVFPRGDSVLIGGVMQRGRWDLSPDEGDTRDILKRISAIFPQLKDCEVISTLVGLRSSRRDGLRLERETLTFGSHNLEVVHNYGQGNGVTLHWGCAQDVTRLVQESLEGSPPSPFSRL